MEDIQAAAEPQEEYTTLMVSFDVDSSREEMRIIESYCKQFRGQVIDVKHNQMFSAATCAVPKSQSGDFKFKLYQHLEKFRADAKENTKPTSGSAKTKWV